VPRRGTDISVTLQKLDAEGREVGFIHLLRILREQAGRVIGYAGELSSRASGNSVGLPKTRPAFLLPRTIADQQHV
jgi:hypothetical protein